MMSCLRIKDNIIIDKSCLSDCKALTQRIADKSLDQLEREGIFVFPEKITEAEDLTKDQVILRSINDTYQTSNVMGYIGYGKDQLIIESRFSNGTEDHFFKYMLNQVLAFPTFINLESETDFNNQFFDYLLFLFPHYLRNALRKGPYKQYVLKHANDEHIRGSIDVPRHIKQNIPFTGKIAYHEREFSYDNNLMQLIRHTIELIKRKSYGQWLLSKVQEEVNIIRAATPSYSQCVRQKVVNTNKTNPIKHAYFREYLALQKLCILILQYQKHQMGTGNRQIYGFLVDGAWLWEEYVNLLISKHFYHPMNKSRQGAQKLFDKNTGLIYPDFISQNADSRVIADAKYKLVEHIRNRDYLQLLAYMYRFDAKTGLYLYPSIHEDSDILLRLNSGTTYEANVAARDDVTVIKHGLVIPQGHMSYEGFVNQIQMSEKSFLQTLLECVQ